MQNIFFDIGLMIIIATVGGYLAKLLKQPLIPAYILVGFILGPVLGLVTNVDIIRLLAEIGIAFLLFTVGIELDLKKLRDIGNIASLGGLLQFFILFTTAFFIAIMFGYIPMEAIYVGLVLAFSSTMVVIKLLGDKHQLDTLHGRVIIGLLLMQDIIAILALSVLATAGNGFTPVLIILSLLKGVLLFVIAYFASRYIFPYIFKFAARSQELLFLVAVSLCFVFAISFNMLGFSIAIGAFVAGLTIANLPYNIEVMARVRSLKDFFATLFFVTLGMELILTDINASLLWFIFVLIIFTTLFKPFITMIICSYFGYTKRISFLTSIDLAQISEFSLIIVAQGLILGHISQKIFSIATLIAILSITMTSYFFKFDDKIYRHLSKFLSGFERLTTKTHVMHYFHDNMKKEVILIGYDRIGYKVFKTLEKLKKSCVIVDFNPDVIKKLIVNKVPCIYGDIGDIEVIERLDLKHTGLVISTIPNVDDNMLLMKKVRRVNDKAKIIVTANLVDEALELYDGGADYVILPHYLGGEHVSLLLEDVSEDFNKLLKTKLNHIKDLRLRKEVHPHHR